MPGKIVFSGDLRFISLADCFQILGGNNSTGILKITSPYVSTSGTIYFMDGNPMNGENGTAKGADAVYSMFGWLEGTFEFWEEPVQMDRVIQQGRMEIVLDALRMLDDGLVEKVGPETCRIVSYSETGSSGSKAQDGLPLIKGPLVDYMLVIDEEEFRDGTTIVSEGGHGSWIWVILEGTVRMTKETHNGTMHCARLGEGCFIGTLTSFLQRNYVRNASLTAEGTVQLGVLDTQRLHREYLSLSEDFRTLIPGIDGRLNKVTERAVEVFEGKNRAEDGLLEGESFIVKQGGFEKDVSVITSGQARIVKKNSAGYIALLELDSGEFFGNVPFFNMGHEPQNASVAGKDDLTVKKIGVQALQKEYDTLSGTFKNLLDNVCMCVAITTRLIS